MARGDIPYTRLECNIFLHAVIGSLNSDCFSTWVKLHCYAVHERRETFQRVAEESELFWRTFTKVCGFRHDKLAKIFERLAVVRLLEFDENHLTICGARTKNPGLKWKDSPNAPQTPPNRSPNAPYGSGSGSVIGSGSVTHATTGVQDWVNVAVGLTGRALPEPGDFRNACLADAKALYEHHGDKANDVLAPLKGSIRYPSRLLAAAVEAIGGPVSETVEEQAARIMGETP